MIRRNTRLRREYLYRKSLEGKERQAYERKRKIREALEGESTIQSASWLLAGDGHAYITKTASTELEEQQTFDMRVIVASETSGGISSIKSPAHI